MEFRTFYEISDNLAALIMTFLFVDKKNDASKRFDKSITLFVVKKDSIFNIKGQKTV